MNETSPLLLIGVGGAGAAIARGVNRASGEGLRYVLADSDASTGGATDPFILLGGDRLSGHGSGGDVAQARLAAEDSRASFDDVIEGVRLAVIVACLGGGVGSGATLAIARHLRERGVPTLPRTASRRRSHRSRAPRCSFLSTSSWATWTSWTRRSGAQSTRSHRA